MRKILSEKNTVGIVPQDSWPWCESLFIADFKFQDHWTFETHPPSHCLIVYINVGDVMMLNIFDA